VRFGVNCALQGSINMPCSDCQRAWAERDEARAERDRLSGYAPLLAENDRLRREIERLKADRLSHVGMDASVLVGYEAGRAEAAVETAGQLLALRIERDEARADRDRLRALLVECHQSLLDLAGSPAEMDDDRMDYIPVQMDRGDLGAARAVLVRLDAALESQP
jgi:hypothetical protein